MPKYGEQIGINRNMKGHINCANHPNNTKILLRARSVEVLPVFTDRCIVKGEQRG